METRRCLLLATIAAVACGGYSAPDEVVFGTGVYTQPAPTADFKPLRTFYLDPVLEVWKDGEQQAPTAVPSAVVTNINTQMAALGYTPSALTGANVGLRLAWFNNSYTYYYGGSWCSMYWGWYGCYPSWGYAGTYSTGTVGMIMVDLRTDPPVGAQRPVLWVSGLYALLYGTSVENTNTFNNGVTRAFAQSPYLKTSAIP